MPSGLTGTVTMVDSIGQIHVNWDNGSSLALQTDKDRFTVIGRNEELGADAGLGVGR